MEDKWQELRKIEAQRTDVLTKLKRIEDKKDTVSPEVYEKVKKEYEEKLESIDAEMSKNVELIKEQLKEIEGVDGVHIMALEWEHRVPEICEEAGLLPRPN